MDIGNPELLFALLGGTFMRGKAASDPIREYGYAVAVNRGPITTRAWRLIRGWNQERQDLGRPGRCGLPRQVQFGLAATTTVRPPATRVSQVGDPWARAFRMGR